MATFKLVIDKRLPVGATYPLSVRVSHQRKNVYLSLNKFLTVKQFEQVFVKKSFDEKTKKFIDDCEEYVERAKNIFTKLKTFEPASFRKAFYDKKFDVTIDDENDLSIKTLYKKYLDIGYNSGRLSLGTKDAYGYDSRSLLKFKPDLNVLEVTPEFLSSFETWYLKDGNSLATVGSIMRSLRCIINYFIKEEIIPNSYKYPFRKYQIPDYTPPKLVITNEEIQSIVDFKDFDDVMEEYARDIWLLLYRMNGINFIDLMKLRWDMITGNHFVFIRHKTRKTRRNNIRPIKVGITDKIQSVLNKIGDKESPFVLGLLNDGYDEVYLKNKTKKFRGKINSNLKKISKKLNLSVSLDISLARDSYANTLKRANINTLKISEQMGHSDPKTTSRHYLDMFDQDTLDEVNDSIR